MTRDDEVLEIGRDQAVYLPLGARHRVENPGDEMLVLIEVQIGDKLDENDIVRLERPLRPLLSGVLPPFGRNLRSCDVDCLWRAPPLVSPLTGCGIAAPACSSGTQGGTRPR